LLDSAPAPLEGHFSGPDPTRRQGLAAGRPPIFIVPGMNGYLEPQQSYTRGLHRDQSFWVFELPGLRNNAPVLTRVEDIAQTFCDTLVCSQPAGPVHLASFCLGAYIAIEMERRLRQAGREVRKLVMVDPALPRSLVDLHESGKWDSQAAAERLRSEERRRVLEVRYRGILLRYRGKGRDPLLMKYPGQEFSINARAKLMAALHCYKPAPVPGTVHLVSSRDRNTGHLAPAASPSAWDHFIPRRRIHIAGETHLDVLASRGGTTAALIQKIYDAPVEH
jgi:thioesterase domain-containing protein